MVSIRLIAFTGWLLLMLNISFVLGVPPKSDVEEDVRHAIKNRLQESRVNVYRNQYLYFCVIWQHFREYFAENENSVLLNFLADLHLTPRTGREQEDLTVIRENLRAWIPEYRRRVAQCPDIRIPEYIRLYGSIGRFMQARGQVRFAALIDDLKRDYVRYRQIADKKRLVGMGNSAGPFTVYAQLARARFVKTVLWTFNDLLNPQVGHGANLVAPEQVNPVVAAPAEPAAVPQPQVDQLIGPVRPNRRRNRLGQQVGGQPRQRGGPPRRGHGHQGRRNGPPQN